MSNKPAKFIFVLAGIVSVVTAVVWWQKIYTDPNRVFNAMLTNSLRSHGVTKLTSQESGGQSLEQTIQLQLSEQNIVRGRTVLTQPSATGETVIETESIGTPTTDYVRYVDIETDQLGESGAPLDFSEVIGVWGRSSSDTATLTAGELYSEATMSVVPFGNLNAEQRHEILATMKSINLYEYTNSEVKQETINGRPIYRYSVEVQPEKYVRMLKQYADTVGLNQFSDLDPAEFKGNPPFNLEMVIDVWSRQLRQVTFIDTQQTEDYLAYGLHQSVSTPENAIPVQELQQRLQMVR